MSNVSALAATEPAWRHCYEKIEDPGRTSIRALAAWDAVDD